MKFLICILFLFSLNVQAEVCSENAAFVDHAGSRKFRPSCYERVVNTDADLVSAGAIVAFNLVSDDAVGVSAMPTAAGGIPFCMMEKSCAAGEKNCRCLTKGYTSALLYDGIVENSAGQQIFHSETSIGNVTASLKSGVAASDVGIGIFYDSSDSAGAVEAYLDF